MAPTTQESKYVIPHHAITKEDRNQIKLRVVFDGSARSSMGSLNQYLHSGPKLQNDIRDILLNWRIHPIAIVADIVKMYRGIFVAKTDRPYTQIFWRHDSSHALCKYELKTVTYGLTCSPWLALRVLKQLVLDHGGEYPEAAKAIANDIFVDDIVTGCNNLKSALELQSQLIGLMREG
ncbi:unnamed protein product, partial [Nesidiocoris tenuis]